MPKIVVTGYADHGKDSVAELLGLSYSSSSLFVCERAVLPTLGPKYGYRSVDECYADRDNHRDEWYQLIYEYNQRDLPRLARELFAENDVYVGWRHRGEFLAGREEGLFDLAIWVDASDRRPPESSKSMTIRREDCDIVIENNGTEEDLRRRLAPVRKILRDAANAELWREEARSQKSLVPVVAVTAAASIGIMFLVTQLIRIGVSAVGGVL